MLFRDYAKAVRREAQMLGIRVPMSKLNDAIALAVCQRRYSAVVAGEKAGLLPKIIVPPPYIDAACTRYRIDPARFRLAFINVTRNVPTYEPTTFK